MVASRASLLGCSAVLLLLGDRHERAFGESTCSSVEVSGIGEPLDGTYTNTPSPVWDHYYYRAGGYDTYTLYQGSIDETWYIQNDGTDYQYATNDLAPHPADITLDWVECVGFLCDDDPAVSQPVITCVEDPLATVSSTCTSVTVSRLGEPLDGTYTNTPSPVWDHYYYRAGGSDTYELYQGATSTEFWYIQNDGTDYQYVTNDLAQHPVDISLEWAKCVGFLCESEPAILQPVITCEGETIAPTPSPTPSASDDDSETPTPTAATPNPGGAPIEETPITPTPSEENGDVGGEGEDGGFSTVSIVGIVIGILAVLGGATLIVRFACRDVQFNFFNGWFNRSSQGAVAQGG